MPRLSIEARRTVSLYFCGYSVPSIVQWLEQKKVAVSKCAVYDLVKKFYLKGIIIKIFLGEKSRNLTNEMKKFIKGL